MSLISRAGRLDTLIKVIISIIITQSHFYENDHDPGEGPQGPSLTGSILTRLLTAIRGHIYLVVVRLVSRDSVSVCDATPLELNTDLNLSIRQ